MPNVNDFFFSKNTVKSISDSTLDQTSDYLASIEAIVRTTNNSIYVIDYQKKGFDYVSSNPLFLCGNTAEEVKKMGYDFYFKHVPEKDIELLVKINRIGFEFYDKIPLSDRKNYTISYDFQLLNNEKKSVLINQKLTPLFLTETGKIWKAICIVSLSNANESGNVKLFKQNSNIVHEYNEDGNYWTSAERIKLTGREKEILRLSSRGFTINEIAEDIYISPNTVKFHRKSLFVKLEVNTISEAIALATSARLI